MMNAFEELNLEKVENICQMYYIEPKSRIEQYCLSAGFKIIKSYESYSGELAWKSKPTKDLWIGFGRQRTGCLIFRL